MSAGQYRAGLGPAGFDPVVGALPFVTVTPTALFLDPGLQDFVQNTDGSLASIHPIDQKVILALSIRKGSISSAPTVGHSLRNIVRAGGPNLTAQVTDRVRQALSALVNAGEIRVNLITVGTPIRGQIVVEVDYANLQRNPSNASLNTVQKVVF